MSSMVSLGVWATGWAHLRATQHMEVVTVSMYVTLEDLSCTTWLVHIVGTVGSSIAFSGMCSRGTLQMVAGDGPPHRQAITSLKPGGGATTCIGPGDLGEGGSHSTCSAWNCSSALWCWAMVVVPLL